jgi:hypothetical protein
MRIRKCRESEIAAKNKPSGWDERIKYTPLKLIIYENRRQVLIGVAYQDGKSAYRLQEKEIIFSWTVIT